ncbi:helix-turn-helix transcriptional regulator [Tropicimonas sp. IMCC6043]|uniref:helix-turn-helix domain-containing protein n=1 Tax=Tropicimonas sp. IMCC6043 TaxID=2510645 RepID=UPI00101CE99F|nr:helix-turn-helix transcriptional regulator [Tropicimonas sp. IMCC6043]RYH11287.1 LuxR family transcriptional regulator [Tropicimonas sp. IMCC6043]
MSIAYRRADAARFDSNSVSRLFEIVAVLSQASQGSVALVEALRRMGNLIGSNVTAICRVDLTASHDVAKVFCHESRRPVSEDAGPFEVSFARGVCGASIDTAKAGTVWRATLADIETRERLASLFRHRRLAETVVIPLQKDNGSGDFLELHFTQPVSATLLEYLEYMGPVLARCWKGRSPGMFSDSMLSRRRKLPPSPVSGAILSMENPCRLSRAEYRVCVLLSRGLNNQAVLEELSITMATLRTHLRNIYAKTDSASQPELIHKLLSTTPRHGLRREGDAYVA